MTVTPATGDLFWVDTTIQNDRLYPTFSDRALQLKRAVRDKLTLSTSPNVSQVDVAARVVRFDPLDDQSASTMLTGKTAEFRLAAAT